MFYEFNQKSVTLPSIMYYGLCIDHIHEPGMSLNHLPAHGAVLLKYHPTSSKTTFRGVVCTHSISFSLSNQTVARSRYPVPMCHGGVAPLRGALSQRPLPERSVN